jgi:hypothetical protein
MTSSDGRFICIHAVIMRVSVGWVELSANHQAIQSMAKALFDPPNANEKKIARR